MLAAIYSGQELLEGMLTAGHPPGVEGVLGHGGWLMVPLSVAVGGLLALLLRGAQAVLALVRGVRAARPARGAGRTGRAPSRPARAAPSARARGRRRRARAAARALLPA